MADSSSESTDFPGQHGFLALPRNCHARPNGWFPGDWKLAHFYIDLVLEANWADAKTPLPRQRITLKMGQLCIDTRKWPEAHGLSRAQFKTLVRRLVFLKKIDPQSNPQGTIITIIDYDKLFVLRPRGQPTNRPTIDPRSTHDRPNQDNTDKKDNIDKESPSPAPPGPLPNKFDFIAADWLQKRLIENNPDFRAKKVNLTAWAHTFRLMREQDGLAEEQITRVLRMTFDTSNPQVDPDPFWRTTIQSAEGFREKWDKVAAVANSAPHIVGAAFQ